MYSLLNDSSSQFNILRIFSIFLSMNYGVNKSNESWSRGEDAMSEDRFGNAFAPGLAYARGADTDRLASEMDKGR
jgi:hypothetical protein